MLMSDVLPLRDAVELDFWTESAALPWVYGRVTLTPVCVSADRTEWLVADHPIAAVTAVTVDGAAVGGFQLVNRMDASGAAVAVVRLTQAPARGKVPAVTVVGAQNARSGQALEHPSEIARDILARCGFEPPPDAFVELQEQMPELACGVVLDARVPVREALDALFSPLGVLWTAAPYTARWPDAARRAVWSLSPRGADGVRAVAVLDNIANMARVTFDLDHSTGQPRQSLSLVAPESVELYGRRETTIELPQVRRAAAALAVAQTILERRAAPMWEVSASVNVPTAQGLAVGDNVTLAHPQLPAGVATVTRIAQDVADASVTAVLVGQSRAELVAHRRAGSTGQDRPTYIYKDGVATLTILDDAGTPLAGAMVMLDGQAGQRTNRRGEVSFKTPRGPHTLTVFADGYEPFEMGVVL